MEISPCGNGKAKGNEFLYLEEIDSIPLILRIDSIL